MIKHIQSKRARVTIGIVVALILALLIFHAGVVFGSHRGFGRYDSYRGFRHPFLPSGFALPHGFIPNDHGAVGTISALTPPTLTMKTRGETSQVVVFGTSTMIRDMRNASTTALSVGAQIVVLGEPDSEGRINAKVIRILPSTLPTP